MKRSRRILLVLSGTLAGGALTGCDPSPSDPADPTEEINTQNTYTNNHYVHGAGYYHAPYRAWYPLPYNHYEAGRGYYAGNRWSPAPDSGPVTASQPTPNAVNIARGRSSGSESGRAASSSSSSISRSGFGSTAHGSSSSGSS